MSTFEKVEDHQATTFMKSGACKVGDNSFIREGELAHEFFSCVFEFIFECAQLTINTPNDRFLAGINHTENASDRRHQILTQDKAQVKVMDRDKKRLSYHMLAPPI